MFRASRSEILFQRYALTCNWRMLTPPVALTFCPTLFLYAIDIRYLVYQFPIAKKTIPGTMDTTLKPSARLRVNKVRDVLVGSTKDLTTPPQQLNYTSRLESRARHSKTKVARSPISKTKKSKPRIARLPFRKPKFQAETFALL